jgi:hypothetical protein
VVVFPFAFHIAVQQPLKPLWSRLLLCDHETSQTSTVLCFMSLLMSLLLASGEILSEFPSPMVILSFFESTEWISIKLDAGSLHQMVPGRFHFGSYQSTIAIEG